MKLIERIKLIHLCCIIGRKSVLEKNKTTTVYEDPNSTEEEVDLVLWLWNAFISWAFEEPPAEDMTVDAVQQSFHKETQEENGVNDESQDEIWSWNVIFREEEHLEYFYFASTVFLLYLVIIAIKKHNQVGMSLVTGIINYTSYSIQVSMRKAQLLQSMQKMKLEQDNTTRAVMRQISYH